MTFCSYFFNNLFFSISNKVLNYLLFEEILYLLTFYRCFLEFFSIFDYLFYLEALLLFLFIFVMHYFGTHFFLDSFFKLLSFLCIFHFILFSLFLFKIFLHFYIFIENFPFFLYLFHQVGKEFLEFLCIFFCH